MGEQCRKFEGNFSRWQGREHSVFVNSGSSANLILLQALINCGRLQRGDAIGVSGLTWATNVMPIIQLGLTPVLLDCSLETLNIDPLGLKSLIRDHPMLKCLFITNSLGFADHIDRIAEICCTNNIILLEDNCEALGSQVGNVRLGNYGLASTFSFFVGHHMSTIEGGLVATDDVELADHLIMCRAHGWDRDLRSEKQSELRARYNIDEFYSKYTFYTLGFNVRPTEINGFLGNIQLTYLDEIIARRQQIFNRLLSVANDNENLYRLSLSHMSIISAFSFPVIAKTTEYSERIKTICKDHAVEIRPMIAGNIGLQPFYYQYSGKKQRLPIVDHIHHCGFYFSNSPELDDQEISILEKILSTAR